MIEAKWIKTNADRKWADNGGYVDADTANRVVRFVESHINLSTTGKPFKLLDFQKDFITQLFGFKSANGLRRYTRCLLTSGKKSFGKTVLASALSLYLLMADGVQSPLVVLGAVTREQATQLFKEVSYAVKHSEFLDTRIDIKESTHRILYPKQSGELKAISSEAPGKGGWNCSACILDEVALAPNPSLYEMLKGSMKARREPLLIALSNAGFDKGHFYYRDLYKPAKDILTNESDDTSLLPVIYEVPEELNWKENKHWPLANPALGSLLSLDSYRDEYTDALRNKAGETWFRRFALNQWTSTEQTWIDLDLWDLCLVEDFPPLDHQPVYIGVDLSSTHDITSVCACYPIEEKYYVKSYNFVPKAAVEKRDKQNLRDYAEFASQGHLKIIEGNCIDYQMIRHCIKSIPGNVQMVIFDRWNSLETSQLLEKEGYNVFNFPQYETYFNEPCKKLETLTTEKKLVHDGNSCLRWCVNNTSLKQNEKGLVKPVKSSEAMKIDATVSLLMALSQAMLHAAKDLGPSQYEKEGVTFF